MRMTAFVLSTMCSIGRYILTTLIVSSICRLPSSRLPILFAGPFLQSSVILTLSASKLTSRSSYSRSSNSSKSRPVSLVSTTGSLAPSSSRQAASNKSRSGTAEIESIATSRTWSITPTPATPRASAFAHNPASNIITEDEEGENDPVANLTEQFVNRRMTRSASRSHSEPPSNSRAAGSRASSVSAAGALGSDTADSQNKTPYGTRRTSRAPGSISGRRTRL